MQDESKPMKLIRMSNTEKYEVIFDVPSNKINTLQSFMDMCTDYGNFFFDGDKAEHKTLIRVLMQKMGHGRKIDILGWQPEGFWVWNNMIVIPGERTEEINEEGLFKHKNNSYYIPSANSIYAENHFKYTAQKKFNCFKTETSIDNYLLAMSKVHREHAITGILFAIACLYQNVISDKLGFFPLLFYFGPASTGKDNLAEAIQSFVGRPQSAINLEGNVSTIKAQIREFAQFSNGISQLSEYKRGNPQLDGVLKGLWDRRGYKRGNVDSFVGTEEIPILSAAILTGNDYPDAQALITRLIWDEMAKNEFSEEDKRNYNDLKDIVKKGISGLSNYFINLIFEFEQQFLDMYRANKVYLNGLESLTKDETPARIIDNLSVLFTVYTFFENRITFPFGRTEILKHFENMANNQRAKLKGTSPINKFWDCFLICMRVNTGDQIRIDQDIKVDGDLLLFNFTNIFTRIQKQWFLQFRESCPGKTEMRDLIKQEPFFRDEKKSERIAKNINSNTSAMVLDLTKVEIKNEILTQIEIQKNKGTLLDPDRDKDEKIEFE
jgi:DNA primase